MSYNVCDVFHVSDMAGHSKVNAPLYLKESELGRISKSSTTIPQYLYSQL